MLQEHLFFCAARVDQLVFQVFEVLGLSSLSIRKPTLPEIHACTQTGQRSGYDWPVDNCSATPCEYKKNECLAGKVSTTSGQGLRRLRRRWRQAPFQGIRLVQTIFVPAGRWTISGSRYEECCCRFAQAQDSVSCS